MSKNKVVKPVSFNITKPDDIYMLEKLEGKNFSGYVKKLILADIQKQQQVLRIVKKSERGGIKLFVGHTE